MEASVTLSEADSTLAVMSGAAAAGEQRGLSCFVRASGCVNMVAFLKGSGGVTHDKALLQGRDGAMYWRIRGTGSVFSQG